MNKRQNDRSAGREGSVHRPAWVEQVLTQRRWPAHQCFAPAPARTVPITSRAYSGVKWGGVMVGWRGVKWNPVEWVYSERQFVRMAAAPG